MIYDDEIEIIINIIIPDIFLPLLSKRHSHIARSSSFSSVISEIEKVVSPIFIHIEAESREGQIYDACLACLEFHRAQ